MLKSANPDGCAFCLGRIIDAGEEMVCTSCGAVSPKEVIEIGERRPPQAVDYTTHSLGSFLGPLERGADDAASGGFSGSTSTFRYLKTISDFSYKDGAAVYNCARLIERVCEKLGLPRTAVGESVEISKRVMQMREGHGEITLAAISAFAIINACKRLRVSSVGVREIIEAHRNLGYRVKSSVIIQISIDSPVKTRPRRAEEYLGNVIAHLQSLLGDSLPPGYINELYDAARTALEEVDGPSRGGHNPRALAASAVYAGETALSSGEGRKRLVSQRELARCVDVAEYTVREQFVEVFRPKMEEIMGSLRTRANPRPRPPIGTDPRGLVAQPPMP
jgi:transcription initiation factor TFIIIB Brf1 subunit/transcription initiation factor TFIIB